MASLLVRLLGPLHVTLDGEAVTGFESYKAQELFAYPVPKTERPHRREKLPGLSWPDRPEQPPVQTTVASWRTSAGSPAITIQHRCLCISLGR